MKYIVVLHLIKMIGIVVLLAALIGCGKSPTGPLPPVLHAETFEEHVAMMKTPGHVAKWLEQFSRYSNPYTGWAVPEGKDLAWSLAHDLWENYINGYSRGKCGSFAAMMVLCAREHGYDTGVVVWYHWDEYDGTWGHAEAWVKESGGISILSNQTYTKGAYGSFEEMKQAYIKAHVSENGYVTFYNSYWEGGEVYSYGK